MSSAESTAALPRGSLVLVTGANGFVGSHVVESLLENGYRVRGTARATSKLDSLKKLWDDKYPRMFKVVEVENIFSKDALHEAIKGCDGLVHVASNMSLSTDVETVVRDAVEGTLSALRAAASTPSIKRVVITSSIAAVGLTAGDRKLGKNDFMTESIEMAKAIPVDSLHKPGMVYISSKTQAEQAAWMFVEETKPSFVMNTVCPAWCLGKMVDESAEPTSSAAITKALFTRTSDAILSQSPISEMVSVDDIALLHVGALTLAGISNERLIGSAVRVSWNEVLAIFRKNFPQKEFYDDIPGAETPSRESIYETANSLEVLKRMGKETGWTSFEQALLETVTPFA